MFQIVLCCKLRLVFVLWFAVGAMTMMFETFLFVLCCSSRSHFSPEKRSWNENSNPTYFVDNR